MELIADCVQPETAESPQEAATARIESDFRGRKSLGARNSKRQESGDGVITIWGRTTSSNVQKVLWLVEELKIPFKRIDAGLSFGRNKDPDFLALNPNGLVPLVQDGPLSIWESNTILRYLASRYGGEHLYPTDPALRSQVERWLDWQIGTLALAMSPLFMGLIRTPADQRDPVAIETARRKAGELWSLLDRQLSGHPYVAGQHFSIADIAFGNSIHRWYGFAIERPSLPHLEAWHRRVGERLGFQTHVNTPIV
jgi:glutathione S-transferase